MRENNAGLTLVELLVSITILGIFAVAAFSFMVSSSNIFKSVETRKNLRMDAQLAANLVESYIIDCNKNIYFSKDSKSLFVINREGEKDENGGNTANKEYIAHIFEINGNSLNYAKSSAEKSGGYFCSYIAEDLICGNIVNFSVGYPSGAGEVSYTELVISLEKDGVKQSITKTIALRNRITTEACVKAEDIKP